MIVHNESRFISTHSNLTSKIYSLVDKLNADG